MTSASLAQQSSGYRVRPARSDEVPALQALIARSAAALSVGYYTAEQSAAAIAYVFGVDTDLVADGSYFVAECDGQPVGCGGWSRRRTLFGGDHAAGRDSSLLDPAHDAAKIRAFFVDPDHARRGIAGALLRASEAAAAAAGFTRIELMATLPGVPFYRAAGFVAQSPIDYRAGDILVPFVPMTKALHGAPREATGDRAGGTQGRR